MPPRELGVEHEAARVHHASRRGGGYVAAKGASAAGAQAHAAGWRSHWIRRA